MMGWRLRLPLIFQCNPKTPPGKTEDVDGGLGALCFHQLPRNDDVPFTIKSLIWKIIHFHFT
jgi:hypothetical protein